MDVSFVDTLRAEPSETLWAYDAGVTELPVPAANERVADASGLSTIVSKLSTPVFGGLFSGVEIANAGYPQTVIAGRAGTA